MNARDVLQRGRQSYQRHAWADAYQCLSRAELEEVLSAEDLELLATSAYLVGRLDAYVAALERAHHVHVKSGEGAHREVVDAIVDALDKHLRNGG